MMVIWTTSARISIVIASSQDNTTIAKAKSKKSEKRATTKTDAVMNLKRAIPEGYHRYLTEKCGLYNTSINSFICTM
jgi:hypothetical protein